MPYSYHTTPGVTYAVECAAEVFVTNPQTGAVAVSGDGSATVYFTATDALYDISDDSAKVQPLFKPAPRLRLALLQGVAGGWLPKGFTELEYLESSGTQNIKVPAPNLMETDETWNAITDCQFLANYKTRMGFIARSGLAWGTDWSETREGRLVAGGTGSPIIIDVFGHNRNTVTFTTKHTLRETDNTTVTSWQSSISADGKSNNCIVSSGALPKTWEYGVFLVSYEASQVSYPVRIWSCKCWCDSVSYDFIPVLDADGTPCMYDKVSRTCFYNSGAGAFGYRIKATGSEVSPMSLRDPYYVHPSGIYARVNGENALDIVADTEETTGEGWEWFANTAEAYAHFGIVPQEEF